MGGYWNRFLRIDLSSKSVEVFSLNEKILREYIGGSGLGAKLIYEGMDPSLDPLDPGNVLVFMAGPLTGTPALTAGRHAVAAKSPLTGIWGEADVGGYWGTGLKSTRFDGIIIVGKAERPVYIWINERRALIRDAEHVWGKDTFETEKILKEETEPGAKVGCIGPAGENGVKFASIMFDGKHARAAGRCGLGAVMGSKNLKAVVVSGNKTVPIVDKRNFLEFSKLKMKEAIESLKAFSEYGTSGGVIRAEELGDLPIRNWLLGEWKKGALKITGQAWSDKYLVRRFHCASCPIGCGRVIKLSQGDYAGVEQAGPEYETLACLGALCLVDAPEVVLLANELCNRYGLDTISTGSVIGFAMECSEHGLIDERVRWGSGEDLLRLIKDIAFRNGIGDLLAEGVRSASENIGGLAKEFAIHVKGLELPAHDPRAFNSLSIGYATSNRGACHVQGMSYIFERGATLPDMGYTEVQDRFGVEGKAEFVAKVQDLMCLYDSAKMCKFTLLGSVGPRDMLKWLNYATGFDYSFEELMKCGERIFNLKRLFNVKIGISRKDDTLPPRIAIHAKESGGAKGNLPPFNKMLYEYYKYRGWDELGRPTPEKLKELGIET
ncbi:MAG: aldehyde ferredoxin oxidoreductase family protein [Synergistetes bacterium]|nr:aldehyde ferredoxin oxidoreductase family protein [Synergistota bacterium]